MASVFDQLEAAARGHIGVDRRFLQSILDQGAAAPPEILRFARSPQDQFPINLDPLLVDLFRYFGTHNPTPEALSFYIDAIRRGPEEVEDNLIQGLLPFGDQAAAPLLALYEELGEEQGSDIAFLLAALRVRDPKVLQLLLDRLEYDAADGAFCLGLYGDQAARPALEKMLSEVGDAEAAEGDEDGPELHREIAFALEQLDAPEPQYQPEPFDILVEYPERELPPFDLLPEQERLEMFLSPEADVRQGAAHSFFNRELNAQVKAALLELAKTDPDAGVRGESWASLGDVTSDDAKENIAIRDAMIAVLNDEARDIEERGGAAVGLYAVADRDDVREGLGRLYELGGRARVRALEAMWRSLWEPYGKYFARQLNENDTDPELLKQVLRGAGYFRLTAHIDKIQSFFDRDEPLDDLREDALFAYALAMPGQTTRGRIRGMLRKIDALAGLSRAETELVMFALDERLRLHGLAPVFETETNDEHAEHDHAEHKHDEIEENAAAPVPAPSQKVGRNDPCPCGSGKKYKKCHGLSA